MTSLLATSSFLLSYSFFPRVIVCSSLVRVL
jgi:hypothetical protein